MSYDCDATSTVRVGWSARDHQADRGGPHPVLPYRTAVPRPCPAVPMCTGARHGPAPHAAVLPSHRVAGYAVCYRATDQAWHALLVD